MNLTNETVNNLINKYIPVIDKISKDYYYPENIKHLLYLIIPAFVIKYGVQRENFILSCFKEIPILISGEENPVIQALYISKPEKKENTIITTKGIVLNRYQNIPLMSLLDNLIHEFNHAINSYKNEIKIENHLLYIRTGLSHLIYEQDNLKFVKKEKQTILEETINTVQTERIIDIINQFSNYQIEDTTITNTLYAIKNSIATNYNSKSYYLQTYLTRSLLENKTFYSTLENLRIDGQIEEIENWFNQICGYQTAYQEFINLLWTITEIERNTKKPNWFVKRKLRNKIDDLNKIVTQFNQNCNFK